MKSCCKDAIADQPVATPAKKKGLKAWLKRIGIAGFLFFLAKGLVWIAIFYGGFHISGC